MSNAGHTDVMWVLTTVPMDHVCHWTMKDAMAPVHLQLSTEHVVVFQKKKGETHIEETDFKQLVSRNVKLIQKRHNA
jgi:hypothetical protein